MSLYFKQQKIKHSKVHGLLTWVLMLACVFAQCGVHASNNQLTLGMQQMTHQMPMAQPQAMADHDCCETNADCCETHQVVTSMVSLELPIATLSAYFCGLNGLIYRSTRLSVVDWLVDKPPTGPPIHVVHCRFTL